MAAFKSAGRVPAAPGKLPQRNGDGVSGHVGLGEEGEQRVYSLYEPSAAFELGDELAFLSQRAIEPNVFFAPQFMLPAMPRLDERLVRLVVARDEGSTRSRLRLLMPFTVERAGLFGGPSILRAWTHPFGPLGTVLLDGDDPARTVDGFLGALKGLAPALPPLLVLPDIRPDGAAVDAFLLAAKARNLPFAFLSRRRRAALEAKGAPDAFLPSMLSPRRRRELARLERRLGQRGPVSLDAVRSPAEVADALETFLVLEGRGWKGRARSDMLSDRYRSAFAREAVNALAGIGGARVFVLRAGDVPVAALVVLVSNGEAVLWKIAYDEAYADASPGFLLLARASQSLIADPDIRFVDSCAVPDSFLVNRIWRDRVEIATLVIGLRPGEDANVARVVSALRRAGAMRRRMARLRGQLRHLLHRGGDRGPRS